MIVDLQKTLPDDGFSLWGFDRPTDEWLMPQLMLIASDHAFERWMFDTALADDRRNGDRLDKWLGRVANPKRVIAELRDDLPRDKPFCEFGRLVYYDLAGRLSVPGVHYIGRIQLRPFEVLLAN